MALKFNRKFDIGKVVKKVVYTVLALYIGGTIFSTFGTVMNQTESAFYGGVTLLGWTAGAYPTNGSHWATTCASPYTYSNAASFGQNCITDVSGAGVLAVIGVIGIASVILEFIHW